MADNERQAAGNQPNCRKVKINFSDNQCTGLPRSFYSLAMTMEKMDCFVPLALAMK